MTIVLGRWKVNSYQLSIPLSLSCDLWLLISTGNNAAGNTSVRNQYLFPLKTREGKQDRVGRGEDITLLWGGSAQPGGDDCEISDVITTLLDLKLIDVARFHNC